MPFHCVGICTLIEVALSLEFPNQTKQDIAEFEKLSPMDKILRLLSLVSPTCSSLLFILCVSFGHWSFSIP